MSERDAPRRQTDDRPRPDEASDAHLGAVETDAPGQKGQGNANSAAALDANGRPADTTKICEDAIGANVDETTG